MKEISTSDTKKNKKKKKKKGLTNKRGAALAGQRGGGCPLPRNKTHGRKSGHKGEAVCVRVGGRQEEQDGTAVLPQAAGPLRPEAPEPLKRNGGASGVKCDTRWLAATRGRLNKHTLTLW